MKKVLPLSIALVLNILLLLLILFGMCLFFSDPIDQSDTDIFINLSSNFHNYGE